MSLIRRFLAGAVAGSAALAFVAGGNPAAAQTWFSVDVGPVAPAYYPQAYPAPVYAYGPRPYAYAPVPDFWYWQHREHERREWLEHQRAREWHDYHGGWGNHW